ncbi:MFS general substrate transporter [Microstroma glucosiphilum]|uniref:MFS general substrate transporter n=1 Tax=Pseudomicrostroma glucosiphilum TaxID=1684307 RepID=A0A316TWR6_9BASI|nr:MFS general substrate transporter [Pseudomicrostroma glucosiphilum]PWN17757.1 MFS general substrate transporter [Pseudomicrostroma glucosiphilum]
MILGLGVGAFLWNPLAGAIGRRPTYLIAWVLFLAFTFWNAFSPTLESFFAARFFAGFAGSVTQCLPVASIIEMYRPQWRGTAIGLWSLFLTLGPPTAPIIGSAVTLSHKWQYVYYVDLIFAGVALIMLIFLCPETMYIPPSQEALREAMGSQHGEYSSGIAKPNSNIEDDQEKSDPLYVATDDSSSARPPISGRIGMLYNPLKEPKRFIIAALLPLRLMGYVTMSLPALYGAIVFGWGVGFTILIPQSVARPPYLFSGMILACCYIPFLVGSLLGKILGGVGSDWTMAFMARRSGGVRQPEHRIWNLFPGVILSFIGLMVYGFGFGHYMAWWVPVVFGVGIYYIGVVSLTGAIQAYLSDTAPAVGIASVQVYNFFKTVWSFGIPFWIAELVGLESWAMGDGSMMVTGNVAEAVIVLVFGLLLCVGLILFGKKLRTAQKLGM